MVTLRQATANVAPKIAEIWQLGWRDGHLGFVTQELVAARHEDSFRSRAAQRVSDTTVAVIDGDVVGFVMVVGDEVEQVYVAARHRGAGVADALMTEAERRITRDGVACRRGGEHQSSEVLRTPWLVRRRPVQLRRSG
jgi:ribosomal protein S18 acetylase RimI-like enzyme